MSTNPIISEELLPCPFCGSDEIGNTGKHSLAFVCMICEASGPTIDGDTELASTWEEAAAAWNRRAADSRANQAVVTERLGRFDHHPDPAIDFEIEVQTLEARLFDAKGKISKPGTEPETVAAVLADIDRAMTFTVGGAPGAVAAKATLRGLEASARAALSRAEGQEPVAVKPVWRCFHCGDEFTDEHAARMHFGADQSATPACQIKGSEGRLVEALRRAEKDAADAWWAIHNETTDTAKAFHAQAARHQEQLRAVEQIGYDRGIADAKAHPETLGLRSALVKAPAPVVPDGWKLVPVEPTEAMKVAAFGPIIEGGRGGPITKDFLRQEIGIRTFKAMLAAAPPHPGATHRHKKRGTEYVLIGIGKMQAKGWWKREVDHHGTARAAGVDMHPVAVYQSTDDGSLWARPIEEWEDGRFEALATPSQPQAKGEGE